MLAHPISLMKINNHTNFQLSNLCLTTRARNRVPHLGSSYRAESRVDKCEEKNYQFLICLSCMSFLGLDWFLDFHQLLIVAMSCCHIIVML